MDYNNNNVDREFGWEDEIEKESEFVLLPEGDYSFKVESFERSRTNGSDKMPSCNMAVIKIRVDGENDQSAMITYNLVLHSKLEWKISEFFAGIGQKKKGEKLKMNWQYVPGSTGRCKVGIRTYNGNQYNEIKKFYPKDPSYNQSTSQQQGTTFTNGQF